MKKALTLDDLPNELLSMIFRRLYKLHRERDPRSMMSFYYESEEARSASPTLDPKAYWMGDPFGPNMFPFAHVKVCQRWRALLELEPMFWTRMTIAVDSVPTPLPTISHFLHLSKDLPVEIHVTKHRQDSNEHDPEEKARVDVVLSCILEHIHHTKDIRFSLLHYASLPALHRWLVGTANVLESIHLSYQEEPTSVSAGPVEEGNVHHRPGGQVAPQFSAPNLTRLSIDSQMFFLACASSTTWLTGAPNLCSLKVTRPGHFSLTEPVSIGATITALSHARRLSSLFLKGTGIQFLEDFATFQPEPVFRVSDLTLEDLTGTIAATLVSANRSVLEFLTVNNCSIFGLQPFYVTTLTLEDLDEECDLTLIFEDLETREINISNCPCFNDTVLEFLADGSPGGADFPAKENPTLLLSDCTNFHVKSLYRMVVARWNAVVASPQWDGTVAGLESDYLSAITRLDVTRGPYLPEAYRRRFQKLVRSFIWSDAPDQAIHAD